jgi:apolipoprotein N-acyltransferase
LRSCLLPALASGALLWLGYFPVDWLRHLTGGGALSALALARGVLAWVALVPLLCLVRSDARPWRIYLSAWLGGLVFFVPVLQWMRVADDRMYVTWIALAVYCALFTPAGVWLVRRLDRSTRLPLVVTVPLVWPALEYFRGTFLGGFGWYFLGHSQHAFLPVIQVADLGGVYVVTVIVAAVNAYLFEWLFAWPAFRRLFALPDGPRPGSRSALLLHTAAVGLLVAGDLGYGCWRLGQDEFTPGPRVALVQGSVPQSVRNDTSGGSVDAGQQMFDHYNVLSQVAAHQQPKPELVVWPETCYPDYWSEVAPGVPPEQVPLEWREWVASSRGLARDAPTLWPTNVLLGMDSKVLEAGGRRRLYNSSVLIRENGEYAGRYDKMHLVPFGEYVPLRDWVPWMDKLAPYDFDYSVTPGERWTRFQLGGYHFGMVICYEDTDPTLARRYVRPGAEPQADFFINTSNDGWFNGTSEHEEHLAMARFRAVECRRSLLRAVNMGISAVVDPNGRVLEPATRRVRVPVSARGTTEGRDIPVWEVPAGRAPELPLARWGEFKKVPGVLTVAVPIDHRFSLYAAWGDWLPWTCWLALGVALAWTVCGPWVSCRVRRQGAREPGRSNPC